MGEFDTIMDGVRVIVTDIMKRLTVELGGKSAGLVLPRMDPEAIAETLIRGNSSTAARLAPR